MVLLLFSLASSFSQPLLSDEHAVDRRAIEVLSSHAPVTVADSGPNAFGRALVDLGEADWQVMRAGKAIFVRRWKAEGVGHPDGDGLGPLFNADSCAGCHFKDGRGALAAGDRRVAAPAIVRLGQGSAVSSPAASWGAQLQDRSVLGPGHGEAGQRVLWREQEGRYPDGTRFRLRRPELILEDATGVPIEPLPAVSLRIPPTLVGVGYLEAVSEATLLEWSDPEDLDGDGISGRVSWIGNENGEAAGRRIGRFGWKAGQASLRDQVVAALAEDMGISSLGNSPGRESTTAVDFGSGTELDPEITTEDLDRLIAYLQFLAPPARRAEGVPEVTVGGQRFEQIGCSACHRPRLMTATATEVPGPPVLAERSIEPFTDLLLHDLGPELADGGVDEPRVSRREWRTAPLWGLGLLETVNGQVALLHDGRARTFEEAILWHGGEAEAAKQRFMNLPASDREALLLFLGSL